MLIGIRNFQRTKILPTVRVIFALSTVAIGVLFLLQGRARAVVSEGALQAGHEMVEFMSEQGVREKELELNGQTIHLATGTTKDSVDEVLRGYQREYGKRDAGLLEYAKRKSPAAAERLPEDYRPFNAFRLGNDKRGVVLAIDMGEGEINSPKEAMERLGSFTETGRVADFGQFRYVYATRERDKTRFLRVWTGPEFDASTVFAKEGDSPGFDLADVPRPPAGRRMMSAKDKTSPARMIIYETDMMPEQAHAYYVETMTEDGWKHDLSHQKAMDASGDQAVGARMVKGKRECEIYFTDKNDMTQVVVTMM